jgi:hypothetical protein
MNPADLRRIVVLGLANTTSIGKPCVLDRLDGPGGSYPGAHAAAESTI